MTHVSSTTLALRLLLLLAVVALLPNAALADDAVLYRDAKGLPIWETAKWTDAPVRIELPDHEALNTLLDRVPIQSFARDQIDLVFTSPKSFHIVFEPRVTEAEKLQLTQAGYKFEILPDLDRQGREETEAAWLERAESGKAWKADGKLTYPTHAEVGTDLAALAGAYSDICRTFSWGQSIQGRELWGIVISDDVQNSEAEPEVRLSSSMHGDETVGIVMTIELAHYLVENYGQPGFDQITNLVNNTEIVLMPMYNPDGYVLDQRYNANGVDLNRNFAEPAGTHTVLEQENSNFQNHAFNNHFVISANMHGGALVINYLWDYTYTLAPDNDVCIPLSLAWSTTNLPMYNGSFSQGITNGADWYVATGTLQDWSYEMTGCMDVTAELSNTKWPSASTLDGFWDDNRQGMVNYLDAVHNGIHGVVTGSDSGMPLNATITITGNAKSVTTHPAHGDFYKMLPTGTWDMTVTAAGYIPQTIQNISTTWGAPTIVNVALDPVAHGDVTGTVTDLGDNGLDASVRFYHLPVGDLAYATNATAVSGGAYSASLVYGNYRVDAISDGFVTGSQDITIGAAPIVADFDLAMAVEINLFSDIFEGTLDTWTGNWGITDPADGYNSANSMNDSPGGTYADSADNTMEMSEGVDMTGAMSGVVSFWAHWEIENTWDGAYFEVSKDGGMSWTPLATAYTDVSSGQGGQSPAGQPVFDNNQAGWVHNSVDLSPWLTETDLRFRFRISSDTSIHHSGFFVDDFLVVIVRPQGPTPVAEAPVRVAHVAVGPNPFNPTTTVKFSVPVDGPAQLRIFDVQGRLVKTLASGHFAEGDHQRVWDGSTESGRRAASGNYFVLLQASGHEAVQKVSLIK